MSTLPWMRFFWAEFFAQTTDLTPEQKGCYVCLLGRMWRNGGWLPNDDLLLRKASGVHPPRWDRNKASVLALFTVEDDRLTHEYLTAEWQRMAAKRAIRAAAGSLGGQATAQRAVGKFKRRDVHCPVHDLVHGPTKTPPNPFKDIDQPTSKCSSDTEYREKEGTKPSPLPRKGQASASPMESKQQLQQQADSLQAFQKGGSLQILPKSSDTAVRRRLLQKICAP
jgi:uncharacterized protein YdaU (DUF1376 family)